MDEPQLVTLLQGVKGSHGLVIGSAVGNKTKLIRWTKKQQI